MTALQWIVKEAKAIKKKYPKRFSKWTDYVAQASAIYASKHKGKSPVGKKKAAPKKTAKKVVKKSAPKKVGTVVRLKSNLKNIKSLEDHIIRQKEFLKTDKNNLRLKNTIKLNENTLRSLKEGYALKVKSKSKKVGATPKKRKPIKEQAILNKIHKVKDQVNQLDELQHKHMIGSVQKDALRRIADLNSAITMKEGQYKRILRDKKMWVDAYGLASYQKNLKAYRNIIAELKKHKAELKKHI
jgi:hypothetical protein